jgi:hypothetical protein
MFSLPVGICSFVRSSDIVCVDDNKQLDSGWEMFSDACSDVTFGDADKTLISVERFLEICDRALSRIGEDPVDDFEKQAKIDLEEMIERAKAIPANVYIDLEN